MTQEPDLFGKDGAIDEQIRRYAVDPPELECPAGIAARVLGKVKRRRFALRAGYAAAAALVLTAIGVSSYRLLESHQPGGQLAKENTDVHQPSFDFPDPSLTELDREYLAAPPPVMPLSLIFDDQIAMFHCLETLEEDSP